MKPSIQSEAARHEFDPSNPVAFFFVFLQRILLYFAIIPAVFLGRHRFGERFLTLDVAFISLTLIWMMVATSGGCGAMDMVDEVKQASYEYDAQGVSRDQRSNLPIETLKAMLPGEESESEQSAQERAGNRALEFLVTLGVGLTFTALIFFRYLGVVRRFIRDDFSVHSYADGEPVKLWLKIPASNTLKPYIVRCIGEPLLFFSIGLWVAGAANSTAMFVAVFVFTLGFLMQQSMLLGAARASVLDKADAQLESTWSMQELELVKDGKEPEATQGPYIPPIARPAVNARTKAAFAAMKSPT